MRKYLRIAAIVLAALIVVVVGIKLAPGGWKGLLSSVYFGLGLKPRAELRFEIQIQDVVKEEADAAIGRLYQELRKAQIDGLALERNEASTPERADSIEITLKGVPAARGGEVRNTIGTALPGWLLTVANETEYRMKPRREDLAAWKRQACEQTLAVLVNRIRGLGLVARAVRGAEPLGVVVQLASAPEDPERLNRVLSSRSRLELAQVMDGPFANGDEPVMRQGGRLAPDTKVIRQVPREGDEGQFFLLRRSPVVGGRDLRTAKAIEDDAHGWVTAFSLNKEAAARFGRFTEANVGNRLAIVLDNRIMSTAVITSRIEESAIITGMKDEQQASDLALMLRAGELPAGLVAQEGQ